MLPTSEQGKSRWHIVTAAASTLVITSLRASDDGLFSVQDATILDPTPRRVPGIVQRTLRLDVAERGPASPPRVTTSSASVSPLLATCSSASRCG